MHRLTIRRAATLALVWGSAALALAADTYPVELHRPHKKGNRYRQTVTATQTERSRTWVHNALVQDTGQQVSIDLTAVSTVRKVDAKGIPTRETHEIERCVVTQQGESKPIPVLPKGGTVEAYSQDGKDVYRIDGKEPDKMQALVLSLALPILGVSLTEDEMFGTDKPRKQGETWPVRADGIARVLNSAGLALPPDSIQGRAGIAAVKGAGQKAVLSVEANVTIEPFAPPLPSGFRVEKARMTWKSAARVPVDRNARRLGDESQLGMTFRASGKAQGAPARIESQSAQKISRTYRYLR